MKKTLAEIAEIIEGEVIGDESLVITGINGIQDAQEGDLTFVGDSKFISLAQKTKATAIITSRDIQIQDKSVIQTDNASFAFSKLIEVLFKDKNCHVKGIHSSAVVASDAVIGKNVSIGPCAVIESQVRVGDNSIICGGSFVGYQTCIGKDCHIYHNVTIREKIVLGNRVIIHSGTVIGSDGFGFTAVDGVHHKIPQIGTVHVEDDVEIGANVAN